MKYLNKFPVIIITLSFLLGLIVANFYKFNFFILILFLFIIFFISLVLLKKGKNDITLSLALIIPLILGIIRFEIKESNKNDNIFNSNYIKKATIYGKIKDVNLLTDNSLNIKIITDSIKYLNRKNINRINLLVKVRLDSTFNRLKAYEYFKVNFLVKFNGKILSPPAHRVFGDINYKKYLKTEDIYYVAYTKYDSTFIIKKNYNLTFNYIITELRHFLDVKLSKVLNYESYSLLRGIILGDRGAIDEIEKDNYSKSGVAHVLAVSGLHVGLIIFLLNILLLRVNIELRYLLIIIFILLYCLITGNSPSVVRATIMGIIYLLSKYYNRDYAAINSLFLTLLIILIYNPFQIYSIGLQLSFISVLTIIIVSDKVKQRINELKVNIKLKNFLTLWIITIACQITTLPILLFYFNRFSIIAIFSNLIVIPLISFILFLGIINLVTAILSLKMGLIIAVVVQFLVKVNNTIVNLFANLKFSYVEYYGITIKEIIVFYFLIFLLLNFTKNKLIKYITFSVIFLFGYFIYVNNVKYENGKMTVIIIDVGQGDSFLIITDNGKSILIDAGNKNIFYDAAKSAIIPTLKYYGIKQIDYVFISHIDADHYLGFSTLIKNFNVKKLFKPKKDLLDEKEKKFEIFLAKNNINYEYPNNSTMQIDNVKLYILNDANFSAKNGNEKSLVIKLCYGKFSFLFMGDANKKMEKFYTERYGEFLQSEVLKAGHHGSNSSSDSVFLSFVKPKYSVISCGVFNPYGLPSEKVINRLNKISKVLRTDELGTIIFTTDGEKLIIKDLNNSL